ncbi:hypothetical protein MWT55_005211 [Pseudomonas aeruginosa]|nr:hypothetical protein [Pseudomonas aeruginosa]
MKRIAIATLTFLTLGLTQASYTVKIPLDNKIKYYQWSGTEPVLSEWINDGDIYDCSNWSPPPTSITIGELFIQTATDCKQDQTRSRQDREEETTTKAVRNKGTAVTETQTITVSSTRTATGTRENWVAATPTYSAWQNQGSEALCNYQDWNPPQHHYCPSVQVTQTRDFCQVIVRTQYKREVETNTGAYRTIGTSQESQIIQSRTETRTVTGTRKC